MDKLTIQACIDSTWHDVALLTFPKSQQGDYRSVSLQYLSDYALAHLARDDIHAVSLNYPVAFFFDDKPAWLTFLDDIIPAGASRRYWLKFLDISDLSFDEQNYILLKFGAISPVGHLRIKEAVLPHMVPDPNTLATPYFSVADVKNRGTDFLDYAQQKGAIAGGATGAGGEAPKLLLRAQRENNQITKVWVDPQQDDFTNTDTYYLVKYPRGSRSAIDCHILRAEYHYYHELESMGVDTIATELMRLEEGENYPSLWLPRFDVRMNAQGKMERLAMESVYSMLGKGAGAALDHGETIRALIAKITSSDMVKNKGYHFDIQRFVTEWVRRDLLNILFGNSDNHGRNTAFLRDKNRIYLAPIYDFAPMKADPEGIPRTIKWAQTLELGGGYNFIAIAESLSDLIAPEQLLSELMHTAKQCLGLKARLMQRGVPEQILTMPAIGMDFIEQKLVNWGLL